MGLHVPRASEQAITLYILQCCSVGPAVSGKVGKASPVDSPLQPGSDLELYIHPPFDVQYKPF